MKDAIKIKPHHFVDIVRDLGADELHIGPHPYGHSLDKVTAAVLKDRDVTLQIELAGVVNLRELKRLRVLVHQHFSFDSSDDVATLIDSLRVSRRKRAS